jgi:hypothetical protein
LTSLMRFWSGVVGVLVLSLGLGHVWPRGAYNVYGKCLESTIKCCSLINIFIIDVYIENGSFWASYVK